MVSTFSFSTKRSVCCGTLCSVILRYRAVCVVSGGVRSWLFYRAALLYRAIAADDIVISNVVESALKMPLSDFVHTDVHPRIGVRTMDYDKVNFSHVSCV